MVTSKQEYDRVLDGHAKRIVGQLIAHHDGLRLAHSDRQRDRDRLDDTMEEMARIEVFTDARLDTGWAVSAKPNPEKAGRLISYCESALLPDSVMNTVGWRSLDRAVCEATARAVAVDLERRVRRRMRSVTAKHPPTATLHDEGLEEYRGALETSDDESASPEPS
jgi:hypothetical protein